MKAKELDIKFDEGESVLQYFDTKSIKKPELKLKRVNVDFPTWMVNSLDREAGKLGVSRQAIIKMIISEQLKHNAA
jgi:hypothetical protein